MSAIELDDAIPALGLHRHIPDLAIEWMLDHPDRKARQIEGTLCFADVSGFTALAERLAGRGRVGGEELVETLGRVFRTMLDIVHERGGMLLKFGGDALLLFFPGRDHAVHAACAALEMRRELRAAADMPTSVGPLKLSMSVGLHSGNVHFFLIGSRHRELLLLGPAANTVVETENAAGPGEILLSTATAALLPAGAVKSRSDGQLLLRWRRAPLPPCGRKPKRAAASALPEKLFPQALGHYLATATPEPEHRVACIAFVRFSGTDAILANEGPEALAGALEATIGTAQEALEAEGVTLLAVDVDQDGGKLFLGAGVPYAQEDACGAMLRALRRIADTELPLALQMGVNRGHVFVAEVGAPGRAAFSAMGDTTNTAARIAAKAPLGAIYAHPAVLEDSLTTFDAAPAEPLSLKGKKAPLGVYEVGPQIGARRREGLRLERLIGREQELASIADAIARLAQGTGAVLCVSGGPGLGKSRLLHEALSKAEARPVLSLRAEPYGANSPYRIFRDPMRSLLGIERGDAASMQAALARSVDAMAPELTSMLALLGELAGIDVPESEAVRAIEPRFRPQQTARALHRLLERVRSDPAIIVLDDAQWCDQASAELLQHLTDATESNPYLLLIARRESDGGFLPQGAEQLALGPMAAQDIRTLVLEASENTPLRPHEVETVVQRASGNPLVAAEILRAARSVGSVDAVPESLEATMAVQVDALDPPARRLLRYASVLGRSFSRRVLTEVLRTAGRDPDESPLQRLTEFLEPDGPERLRFRSGVLRDATYESLAYRLRSRLHRIVAETMERVTEDMASIADSLALHYARAQDHRRAWHHARIAGDRARQAYANADAARYYELALEAARRVRDAAQEELLRCWISLGEARERAGLLEGSLEAFRRAMQLAGDDRLARADLLHARASAKERMRSFPAALRDLTRGLRLIEDMRSPRADALRARLKESIAWIRFGQDKPASALARAADAAAEARAAGEQASLGGALVVTELARLTLEGPGDGRHLREALSIFESLGDLEKQATVRANLGFVCAYAGHWDEAVTWLTTARDQFLHIGDVIRATDPALNLGEMLVKKGRYDEAESVLRDAMRALRAARFFEGVNRAEIQLGRILIARGELDAAETMLARVQEEFTAAGQSMAALEAAVVRASGLRHAGADERALSLLDRAARTAGRDAQLLLPMVACERGPALAALGHFTEALDTVAEAIETASEQGLPYEKAILIQTKARIVAGRGGIPDAAELATAQEILDGLGIAGSGSGPDPAS